MTPARLPARLRGLFGALVAALALLSAGVPPATAQENPALIGEGQTADQPGGQSGGQTAPAQTTPAQADQTAAPAPTRDADEQAANLDYAAWEQAASRAETALQRSDTADNTLEQLRSQLADWREALLLAQSANSARIATLRTQIGALGAAPADGTTEPEEIAARRRALNEQLVTLQAPGIAADEAYSRANGLISEIDKVLRERQADALLRLWPAPINPANWDDALLAISDSTMTLWQEVQLRLRWPSARSSLADNMPLILLCIAFAVALIWRGRALMERLSLRLQDGASLRGRRLWALVVSLGQILIPTLGVMALTMAARLSSLTGVMGSELMRMLPAMGFTVFAAAWLGGRIFAKSDLPDPILQVSAERRAEGRVLVTGIGVVLALGIPRNLLIQQMDISHTAISVLSFPAILVLGLLLWRLGHILRKHVRNQSAGDGPVSFRNRVLGLLGAAAILVGIAGPLMGAIGYIGAATLVTYASAVSLGLIALIFILQQVIGEVYKLVTGGDDTAHDALLPVLMGFVLALSSLPVFALIWGAREADLTEIWARFREGFQMGDTRISPTDFLLFAVIFAAGYTATRFLQGGLKATILPRTRLDQGGQNAVVSGVGYIGIFLSALIGINSTGIDLSGLALVASALSVGIGFGLQNIVSNFVSGIILLIERPVSEGDWIEVGTTSGTVKAISVRSTRIQTFDRSDVIVPNSDLVQQRVTNWTRFTLTGRLVLQINVPIGSDPDKVETILRDVAEAHPMALLNPAPAVVLMGFGNNLLNYEVRVLLRDVNFSAKVRTEMNRQIVRRFIDARIIVVPGTPEMIVHQGRPFEPPVAASVPPVTGDEEFPESPAIPKDTE